MRINSSTNEKNTAGLKTAIELWFVILHKCRGGCRIFEMGGGGGGGGGGSSLSLPGKRGIQEGSNLGAMLKPTSWTKRGLVQTPCPPGSTADYVCLSLLFP